MSLCRMDGCFSPPPTPEYAQGYPLLPHPPGRLSLRSPGSSLPAAAACTPPFPVSLRGSSELQPPRACLAFLLAFRFSHSLSRTESLPPANLFLPGTAKQNFLLTLTSFWNVPESMPIQAKFPLSGFTLAPHPAHYGRRPGENVDTPAPSLSPPRLPSCLSNATFTGALIHLGKNLPAELDYLSLCGKVVGAFSC